MSKGLQMPLHLSLHMVIYFLVKCTEKNGSIPNGAPLILFEILFFKNHINNGKQINIIF